MTVVKTLELLVGVKAEQSLRDAVRAVIDEADPRFEPLELVPIGRKDWIAGIRVGPLVDAAKAAEAGREVLAKILKLDSRQRIRGENVRLYVVAPPVPVFKDPSPAAFEHEAQADELGGREADEEEISSSDPPGARICPVCNRQVHSFNLQHDTKGRVVGCFICGGDPGYFRS